MSSVIKVTKDNVLSIPIDTILHYTSFFDKVKTDKPNTWDSIGVYIWQGTLGRLHIINQREITSRIKGCYVNVIVLDWDRKFLFEGDTYYKVFLNESQTIFHKLEFDGVKHSNALILKPYEDKVYSNTNFMANDHQRFETIDAAEEYCYKVRNRINVHDGREW